MQTPDIMTAVALAIQYPEEEIVVTDNSPNDVDHTLQNAGYEIVDVKNELDYSFVVYSNVWSTSLGLLSVTTISSSGY